MNNFLSKNRIRQRTQWYQFLIAPQKQILHVGCGQGDLLAALSPSYGYGFDTDAQSIEDAKKHYPLFSFGDKLPDVHCFDYIICSPSVIMKGDDDIQLFFAHLALYGDASTRFLVVWESPLFSLNSFSSLQIRMFLSLAGFSIINQGRYDSLHCFIIAAHKNYRMMGVPDSSVSIIIPCRNERGTIEAVIQRCPAMGASMEFIFVDGNSTDGTLEELYHVQKKYPDKTIRIFKQVGQGKGDAVRLGFSYATGDIGMILDSDLAVGPEELPKFYHALRDGLGDVINGSRLIYPMQNKATPWLNYLVNHIFALIVSWIIGQRVTDTLCGTKVVWREDYERIMMEGSLLGNDPFGDFKVLFGAARLSKKIIDMPVHYKNRVYGSSQIGSYFYNGLLLLRLCWHALYHFKLKS
jgi:Glycosyl transferase family 2